MTETQRKAMQNALDSWASDLERGMQVFIPASSLRKIANALEETAQEPVTDEENERFSQDVSDFVGADPEATKHALEEFLRRRTKTRLAHQPVGGLDDATRIGWAFWRIRDLEEKLANRPAFTAPLLANACDESVQESTISLPREMDEDLYYIVGSAMGAQSPEQCERADGLWRKLVVRAERDKARQSRKAVKLTPEEIVNAGLEIG